MHTGFGWRHPEYSQKGCETHLAPSPATDAVREPPAHKMRRRRVGHTPRRRPDLVDPHRKCLAGTSTPYGEGTCECVPNVDRGISRRELVVGIDVPGGIRNREADGVARCDRQNRRDIAREVAVQHVRGERERVDQIATK
jgi:hypothetical protein